LPRLMWRCLLCLPRMLLLLLLLLQLHLLRIILLAWLAQRLLLLIMLLARLQFSSGLTSRAQKVRASKGQQWESGDCSWVAVPWKPCLTFVSLLRLFRSPSQRSWWKLEWRSRHRLGQSAFSVYRRSMMGRGSIVGATLMLVVLLRSGI